ncbi:MAG: hypothetical protein HQL40_08380 [Alphaproteobacteria bacterium]|nr:hypothetical protein [Alphaproteobacteria bacterium]
MSFGFLSIFAGIKGKKMIQEVTARITQIDPDTAVKADLVMLEQALDKASALVAELRASLNKEIREAEAAEAKFNQALKAAEILEGKAASADPAAKPAIEASLARLVAQIEELARIRDAEARDVTEAEQLLAESEAAHREKAAKLTVAKGSLDNAVREMKRATIEAERAKEKADAAARVAGLRGDDSASGIDVALNAMTAKTQALRQEAEAARVKREALTSNLSASGDANIDAALAEAGKGGGADASDVAGRLAALRARR